MEYVSKAALDTTLGANFARQDLSPVISLQSTRPRPVSQFAEQVKATNTIHQWVEQGRNGVAGSGGSPIATYSDGSLPNTAAKAPTRPQNVTALCGLTAQVTDLMTAVWYGGGAWKLEQASEVKMLADAMDLETELCTLDTLDFIEWMHISGDSSNPQGFAGGQWDGLLKWGLANGVVVATGGTSGSPINVSENFLKDGARAIAENYPTLFPDTALVPPEVIPDINGYVSNGAGRPLVQLIGQGQDGAAGFVAGQSVAYYNTGYFTVKIELEPNLSPLFNPYITNPAIVLYNKKAIKHASLIPFGATPLAKTDTSLRKMINNVATQEHRVPGHVAVIPNIKSAIA
jgi:hypothetical protein